MKDCRQWTIHTVMGLLGMLLSVLFSVSIAATYTPAPTALANSASGAAVQQ
jgi:hypothetical protein